MIRSSIRLLAALALTLTMAPAAFAQQDEDDAVLKLAEPDFTLVGLPTSLRLARFKSAFRVTHRFTRPLGQGDFGDLAGDLFGIDSGALIGLDTGSGSCETARSASTERATRRSRSSASTACSGRARSAPST